LLLACPQQGYARRVAPGGPPAVLDNSFALG
jgi:hypothetical protein